MTNLIPRSFRAVLLSFVFLVVAAAVLATGNFLTAQASDTFQIGARVVTIASTTVRTTPNDGTTVIGSQLTGAYGTITDGPFITGGGTNPWWQVNFDNGVDGWLKQSSISTSTGPAPTVTITASSSSIISGQSSTLTWSTTNANSCTASGGWSGTKATTSSEVVSPTATTTYTLVCNGNGGTGTSSATVNVAAPTAPTVSITASSTSIISGQSSTLTWSSTDATSCTASNGWSGSQSTSGTQVVSPTATTTYTLACSGAGGTATSSATVNVAPAAGAPTVSFVADPTFLAIGQSSSLTWTSTNATSCSASGGWSGTKTATGTMVVIPTATTTYSLTCSGTGGSATSTLTIGMNVLGGPTNCVSGPSTPHVRLCSVTRYTNTPIVSSTTSNTIGTNITMPSVIKVPAWLPSPMGNYYMYFAGHNGSYIRMAYATTSPVGPWTVYAPGSVKDTQVSPFYSTISSPDVFVQDATHTIRMYFSTDHYASGTSEQWSGVASSTNGIGFSLESTQIIAKYYLRVFQWGGQFYGLQKEWFLGGLAEIGVSSDGVSPFVVFKNFAAAGTIRHMAVLLKGNILMVFFTKIGDAPERIYLSTIDLASGAPSTWEFSTPVEVLRPTTIDEGVQYPVVPSVGGKENNVNELRDPYIFEDNGHTYLYYGIAGETGISVAEITYDILGTPPTTTISASSTSIISGQSSTLTWSSTDATSCTASDGWSGTKATSSSETVSPTVTTTYTLACSGTGGTATSSATVTVTYPTPTVSITASSTSIISGASSTLTWSSTDATSCTASNGWSGTKATTSSQVVSPTATTTYTLACSGAGGTATSSATVNVAHIFGIGAHIQLFAAFNPRISGGSATTTGSQPAGATGTIIGGPYVSGGGSDPWWQIDFDTGADGWVKTSYLTLL